MSAAGSSQQGAPVQRDPPAAAPLGVFGRVKQWIWPQRDPLAEAAEAAKTTIPKLTFGLEMEMNFGIKSSIYKPWRDAFVPLPTNPLLTPTFSKEPYTPTDPRRDSAASENMRNRYKMINYLHQYLTRTLPSGNPTSPSLLGNIALASPKSVGADNWHLTIDDSVRTQRWEIGSKLNIEIADAIATYRTVGAELVSAVLKFDEMATWHAQISQIKEDLSFNRSLDQGAWACLGGHLHVHFAIDEPGGMSIPFLQTVAVLYGIFEHEIETWIPVKQRNSMWCHRMRKGMTRERIVKTDEAPWVEMRPGRQYTPSGYADMIYATETIGDLKAEMSGWAFGERDRFGGERPPPALTVSRPYLQVQSWMSVNINEARDNGSKPLTIEFRHHFGTMDPKTITWWVRFLGKLMRFAHYLTTHNIKIQHDGPPDSPTNFVNDLRKQSILDLINFPDEGKSFFRDQQRFFDDPRWLHRHEYRAFREQREVEERLIAHRIERMKRGEIPGRRMDEEIMELLELELPSYNVKQYLPGASNPWLVEGYGPRTGADLVKRMFHMMVAHDTEFDFADNPETAVEKWNDLQVKYRGPFDHTTVKGFNLLNLFLENSRNGFFHAWVAAHIEQRKRQIKEFNGPKLLDWEIFADLADNIEKAFQEYKKDPTHEDTNKELVEQLEEEINAYLDDDSPQPQVNSPQPEINNPPAQDNNSPPQNNNPPPQNNNLTPSNYRILPDGGIEV